MASATYPARIPPSAFGLPPRRHQLPVRPPLDFSCFTSASTASQRQQTKPKQPPAPVPQLFEDIASLREEINAIDNAAASLAEKRSGLVLRLERAVRSQSPILRLPSELLSAIFVMGVLSPDEENPVMVGSLMLVCHHWADLALATPVLWSRISVSPHDSLQKARRKLSRSKSSPLDVTVDFGARMEYSSSVMEQIVYAMDLIRPSLWRTRSFSLCVPNRIQAHTALLRCKEDAPLLETLSIRICHALQEDHYSTPPWPLFNGHTPRLHSCSFTSFHFEWDPQLLTKLRVLKLDGYFHAFAPSIHTLIDALRECPMLEELSLRNLSDVDSDPCYNVASEEHVSLPSLLASGKAVSLPRLKKVTLYYAAVGKQLMACISCPNLESLEMCYMENVTTVLYLLYTQALTKLPLRFLRIESCLFNEMKFLNLLRRLSSLETLELVDVDDASSSFLKGLSTSQPWACPRMEHLVLDGCTAPDWESLRTFVQSRLPSNSYAAYTARNQENAQRGMTTASASAAALAQRNGISSLRHKPSQAMLQGPKRLQSIDVTRCSQVSKEMIQWLRMYVPDVRCEPAKGIWGEPTTPS